MGQSQPLLYFIHRQYQAMFCIVCHAIFHKTSTKSEGSLDASANVILTQIQGAHMYIYKAWLEERCYSNQASAKMCFRQPSIAVRNLGYDKGDITNALNVVALALKRQPFPTRCCRSKVFANENPPVQPSSHSY